MDVDGTLVLNKRDGMPSQAVKDAVKKASKILHVGVATGRPLFVVEDIARVLELSGPSIVAGGAQIVDMPSQKIMWEQPMKHEDVLEVCKIFSKYSDKIVINDNNKDLYFSDSYKPYKPLQMMIGGLDHTKADTLITEIKHIPTITYHKILSWTSGTIVLDVYNAYATKQHGIFEVAKFLNIQTHDIIGVGDGYNDFPLLMACGLKVAMGNAVDEIKAIADYIAPSVEEEGIADVIETFVLHNT